MQWNKQKPKQKMQWNKQKPKQKMQWNKEKKPTNVGFFNVNWSNGTLQKKFFLECFFFLFKDFHVGRDDEQE